MHRSIIALLLITVCGCSSAVDESLARQFQSAEDSFAKASTEQEYLQAAGQYQQILDSGIQSGTVLYNQGNAFMKAGQPGRAIAAYLQAKRYRPADPLLDSNLRTALKQANVTNEDSIIDRLMFWQNWVSYRGKFALTTFLLAAVIACFLIAKFTKAKWFKRPAFALLVLLLLSAGSTWWDWFRFDFQQHGVVIKSDVAARKGADSSYEPAFTQPLTEGTMFTVQEETESWTRVVIGDAGEAWLPNDSIVVY